MPVLKKLKFSQLTIWTALLLAIVIILYYYEIAIKSENSQSDRVVWDFNWDDKGILDKKEAKKRNVKSFIFVRHGKYDRVSGRLTATGREQADAVGRRLKEMKMAFKAIYSSSSIRAQETAQIIHQHLPKLPYFDDDLLKEGLPDKPSPTQANWNITSEIYAKHLPRFDQAFRKYINRADIGEDRNFYIIVAHGNIIRYLLLRALQLDIKAWMRFMLPHASISLIHINPDGTVTATRMGIAGFMRPELLSWS